MLLLRRRGGFRRTAFAIVRSVKHRTQIHNGQSDRSRRIIWCWVRVGRGRRSGGEISDGLGRVVDTSCSHRTMSLPEHTPIDCEKVSSGD